MVYIDNKYNNMIRFGESQIRLCDIWLFTPHFWYLNFFCQFLLS